MDMSGNTWENNLINLAFEALNNGIRPYTFEQKSPTDLARAYRHCAGITRLHSKTFYMASALLPSAKRQAMRALYAFCRLSDDLVDCDPEATHDLLQAWYQKTHSNESTDDVPGEFGVASASMVALAWMDTSQKYAIPWKYSEQLVQGVARDLQPERFQTFNDLSVYCYGVACTVGLMAMQIVGYTSREAVPYAIRLGVALQMTNILRDVGDDYRNERLYLPLDELVAFQLLPDELPQQVQSRAWKEFMRFQIARTSDLYAGSMPGIAMLNPDGRFAILAAAELYRGILDDIEEHNYDTFTRRAALSQWEKLKLLPGIWQRSRTGGPRKTSPPGTSNTIYNS
jgi:15-cis-phytoene synthase